MVERSAPAGSSSGERATAPQDRVGVHLTAFTQLEALALRVVADVAQVKPDARLMHPWLVEWPSVVETEEKDDEAMPPIPTI
jgi:hypothetical protein